jgi:hypothetical protein
VLALAGTASVVVEARAAFDRDLTGLSAFERAAVALWDLSPLPLAVAAGGALLVVIALVSDDSQLSGPRPAAARVLVLLASAGAAFGAIVLVRALWLAVVGSVETDTGVLFGFSAGDRAAMLVLQAVAYVPLCAFLLVVAVRCVRLLEASSGDCAESGFPGEHAGSTRREEARGKLDPEPLGAAFEAQLPETPLARGERLWQDRLVFSPNRNRAAELLAELRREADAGDDVAARRLLDQLERL